MMSSNAYKGSCFCGSVEIEAKGAPIAMAYCHCGSCRSWSASPVHASTMWAADSVTVTQGADKVATFHKTQDSISFREYCKACGGHVMIRHPSLGMIDIMAPTLPTLAFGPTVHVNYGETVLPMKDGLPKFKDFPADMGGTGEQVPE